MGQEMEMEVMDPEVVEDQEMEAMDQEVDQVETEGINHPMDNHQEMVSHQEVNLDNSKNKSKATAKLIPTTPNSCNASSATPPT